MSAPAFQFYVKDWLSSTKSMGPEAKGVYMDLLAWAWDNGPLPRSEEQLARLAGVSKARFKSIWLAVGPRWTERGRGYVNLKQESQREQLEAFRQRQSEAGKRSAAARAKSNAGSTTVDERLPERLQPNGNRKSTLPSAFCDLPTETRKSKIKTFAHEPEKFAAFYARYPKHVGRDKALKAWLTLAPDDGLIAVMNAALDWQIGQPKWREKHGEYIPHPSSWLNGRRWEDEPFHPPADADDPNAEAFARVLGGQHGQRR